MKTTKQLLKELENKSTLHLTWAIVWRWTVLVLAIYLTAFFLMGLFIGIANL